MSYKKSQDISINKILVAQVVFIAAVIGIIFFSERFFVKELSVFKNLSKNEAVLYIDFDNLKKMFAGEVADGMTVLDALNASVAAGKIEITYYVDNNNYTRVAKINDHESDSGNEFVFYVNSKKLGASDLNKVYIKPGDKIIIKLE